jgi:hypothetical protein
MNVWPFMFAASKTSDYQFVVLPEILDATSCAALRERLEIDDSDPEKTRTATVTVKQAGNVSCVYRSGPIVVDNTVRTDSAGRKLLFAFGVVAKELPPGSSLARLSSLIDASRPSFEKGLVSFLSSEKEWKPVVTKAIKLQTDLAEVDLQRFRMPSISLSAVLVSLGFLVNLGICAALYTKLHSLEAQLSALNSMPRKASAVGDPGEAKSETSADSAKVSPSTSPRAPENKLENIGPLTTEK